MLFWKGRMYECFEWMMIDWKNVNECRKGWNEKLENVKINVEIANVKDNEKCMLKMLKDAEMLLDVKSFQDVKLKM